METKREDLESLRTALDRLVRDTNRAVAESLNYSRYGMLELVVARGAIPTSELGEALDLAPSAVIAGLRELEERELVTVDGPEDRPVATPTPAGCEELRQIAAAGRDVLAAVLSDWSPEEVAALAASLTRLWVDWHAFRQASASKVRIT
jgi:DNA-binding MarR family transcriptional regulator